MTKRIKRMRGESDDNFGQRAADLAKKRGFTTVDGGMGALCVPCQSVNGRDDTELTLSNWLACYNCGGQE